MRSTRVATGILAFLGLAPLAMAVGCFPLDFTESNGGQSGSGGEGGSAPPSCPGDPVADPSLVRDDCGTFVSASAAAGGDGTKAKPFQSLGEAASRGATRIYACAEDYTETANVRFDGGVEIYAGFTDCSPNGEWGWSDSSKATLTGAADAVALTVSGGDNVLRNLNVTAPNATMPGGSSIAVVVAGGTLSARNEDFTAGDAKDGDAGMTLADDPMLDGITGMPGVGVCASGVANVGPMGETKACPMGGSSVGGKGGDGGLLTGTTLEPAGNGTDGTPDLGQGAGGTGEGQGSPASINCTPGAAGASGAVGNSGLGAAGLGSLDVSGWQGTAGENGMSGLPGQGGGGGGGVKGGLNITCAGVTQDRVGSSGGAGGTGGCGGAAGTGGQAGGSSIALVVADATVTLDAVMLVAGAAGNGGTGGNGQNPGQPGQGGGIGAGQGTAKPSCTGGVGGPGGPGGPGGGGQGGHSLGVAFQGTAAPTGVQFMGAASPGTGGNGGLNNTAANGGKGDDGVSGDCWDFAKNAACPQG